MESEEIKTKKRKEEKEDSEDGEGAREEKRGKREEEGEERIPSVTRTGGWRGISSAGVVTRAGEK